MQTKLILNGLTNPKWVANSVAIIYITTGLVFRQTVNVVSTDYEDVIQSILNEHAFFSPQGELLMQYPPVFPLYMAMLHKISAILNIPTSILTVIGTSFCFAIATYFVFKTALFIGLNNNLSLLATLIGCLNPFLFKFLFVQYSEPLYLAVFAPLIYMLIKGDIAGNKFWLAAIFAGLGWLIRPISLFVPFILAGVLALQNRYRSLAFIAISTIVILPWQLYTFNQSGEFHFLSSRGFYGIRDGLSLNMPEKTFREGFELPAPIDTTLRRFQHDYYNYRSTKQIAIFLWQEYKENPSGVVGLYALKTLRSWYGTDAHRTRMEFILAIFSLIWLISFWYGLRILTNHARFKLVAWCVLALILSFWLLNAVTSSLFRYMIPLFTTGSFIAVRGGQQFVEILKVQIHKR